MNKPHSPEAGRSVSKRPPTILGILAVVRGGAPVEEVCRQAEPGCSGGSLQHLELIKTTCCGCSFRAGLLSFELCGERPRSRGRIHSGATLQVRLGVSASRTRRTAPPKARHLSQHGDLRSENMWLCETGCWIYESVRLE